jgi:hypothetical protein
MGRNIFSSRRVKERRLDERFEANKWYATQKFSEE